MPAPTRACLVDLTFAMRIQAKRFSEDMAILLSQAEFNHGALATAAEYCGQFAQDTMRYTQMVEAATTAKTE